jgi:type II secretory pathway pseudopilin PulG
MTLIEVMVALGIIALLLGLLPAMFGRVRKADLRADAGKVAAALRSAYDRAAATAAHHRLVIDLDADKFWIERCEGKVRMVRDLDEAKAEEQQAIIAQMARPPQAGAAIPGMTAPPTGADLTASLAPPPDVSGTVGTGEATMPCAPAPNLKTVELNHSADVVFREVHVSHLEKAADTGKVSINFFPMGRAERAIVVLSGEKDDTKYSVRLHALSGRVEIVSGEIRDAAGIVEGEDVR